MTPERIISPASDHGVEVRRDIPFSIWRSPALYGLLIVGYVVTLVFIAILASVFGSDEMTTGEGFVLHIAMQVLSLIAGYSFARWAVTRSRTNHG